MTIEKLKQENKEMNEQIENFMTYFDEVIMPAIGNMVITYFKREETVGGKLIKKADS